MISAAESLSPDSMLIGGNLGPRSNPDRGSIVARSCSDRDAKIVEIGAKSTAEIGQNCWGIEAASSPQGTASTKPSNNAHDRFQWPRFRA